METQATQTDAGAATAQAAAAAATQTKEGTATQGQAQKESSAQAAGQQQVQQKDAGAQAAVSKEAPKEQASTATQTDVGKTDAAPVPLEIKLPDGAKFDEKALGEFKTIMADAKLTPAQKAQALVDLQWNLQLAQAKAYEQAIAKQSAEWLESVKADKEFGGANFDKTVAGAKSAEAQFFGEEASKLFKDLGIQNHPALVKGLARIRALVAEDNAAGKVGGAVTEDPNSVEATLKRQFPKSWPQMLVAHKNKMARSGTK